MVKLATKLNWFRLGSDHGESVNCRSVIGQELCCMKV